MGSRVLVSLLLIASLVLNPALAGGSNGGASDQAVLDRNEVSEEQLDQFVDAQLAVEEVRKDYYFKLRAVEEMPRDKDKLKEDMAKDISQAVKDAPISEEVYKRIARVARKNRQLRNLIFQRMQAKVSKAEGQKIPGN